MSPFTRKLTIVAAAVALTAAACGSGDSETLTVYSGRSEELIGPLLNHYSSERGVDVQVRDGQSAELALLIQQEGDKSPADVFISQSPGALGLLAGSGLLATQSDETLAMVPAEYRNAVGKWVGISGRIRALVYNQELIAEADLPVSIFDIANDAYSGRVGVAPANGSFQDFVTGMREIHGDGETLEWLTALADNDAQTYANNGAIVQAVARGEVDMGLVNHYYNLRALAEDPSIPSLNHFFDDVGSLVIITGAGVLESSSHRDDAERLVQFLLSDESQEFFTEETFEYPLAHDVRPAAGLPALGDVQSTTYDFDDLAGGLDATQRLINDSGLAAP